jgi:hypothetical protein
MTGDPSYRLYLEEKFSGVTDMLNAGVPLISVQGQVGHTRLSSTQHYAKKYAGVVNRDIKNYLRIV